MSQWALDCIKVFALSIVIACHAAKPRPAQHAEERSAAAIAAWGNALRSGDVAKAEDTSGQFSIVYVAVKGAASHVEGGSDAVMYTVVTLALQSMWPGFFGSPSPMWGLVVPTGPLGPALVEAGLAKQLEPGGPAFAIVPVPYEQTLGRIERAIEDHRARMFAKEAWTCRFQQLEHTVLPTEPSVQRAAKLSTNIFGGWLKDVEAVWIVRASCASGPALFAITAYRNKRDLILLAGI